MASSNDIKLEPKRLWLSWTTVAILGGGLIAFAWSAFEWRSAVQRNTEAISKLTGAVESTWTERDMQRWASTLKVLNPDIKVPDPMK